MVMIALCAWAASPGKRSANSATTALCAWAICSGEGVKRQQICLGEIRVWMRFGSIPWLKIGSDALWLHPGYVHGELSVGRDLSSNLIKGSWYKIGGRALAPPGSW